MVPPRRFRACSGNRKWKRRCTRIRRDEHGWYAGATTDLDRRQCRFGLHLRYPFLSACICVSTCLPPGHTGTRLAKECQNVVPLTAAQSAIPSFSGCSAPLCGLCAELASHPHAPAPRGYAAPLRLPESVVVRICADRSTFRTRWYNFASHWTSVAFATCILQRRLIGPHPWPWG